MRKEDIHIGTAYTCKVGRNTIRVTVTEALPDGGWLVETPTGRTMTVRSAERFIEPADGGDTPAPAATVPQAEPTPATATGADTGESGGTMSLLDAAARLLGEADTPLRCRDLVEQARERGLWAPKRGGKTPDRTLYSAILREIRTKGAAARFRKASRGHFELRV